jgi:hypothetical protein
MVYSLDYRGFVVRFPAGARDFYRPLSVQTVSGSHPASYSVGTGRSFFEGKAAGA